MSDVRRVSFDTPHGEVTANVNDGVAEDICIGGVNAEDVVDACEWESIKAQAEALANGDQYGVFNPYRHLPAGINGWEVW